VDTEGSKGIVEIPLGGGLQKRKRAPGEAKGPGGGSGERGAGSRGRHVRENATARKEDTESQSRKEDPLTGAVKNTGPGAGYWHASSF